MADGMERFSEVAVRAARRMQSQAEALAGVHLPRTAAGLAPPRWTAWLLMERAGVPRDLVAHVCHVSPREVRRGVRRAQALMIWPRHAGDVERLSVQMVPFGKVHVPTLKPAREIACAVLAD
jgi:hypothetical protein